MSEDQEESLEAYWGALGRVSRARPEEPEQSLGALVDPNDFVIGTSRNRILVVIKPDGSHYFGPEYTPSEAAVVFWEEMGRRRLQMEERMLLIGHMEGVFTRMGQLDLRREDLLRQAAATEDTAEKRAITDAAAIVLQQLERIVHQSIELGRGMARRPDVVASEIPEQVPQAIRENPHSDYTGREGL